MRPGGFQIPQRSYSQVMCKLEPTDSSPIVNVWGKVSMRTGYPCRRVDWCRTQRPKWLLVDAWEEGENLLRSILPGGCRARDQSAATG